MFATSGTSDHSPVVGHQRGGVNTSVTFRVKGGHDGLNCPSRICTTSERPRFNVCRGFTHVRDTIPTVRLCVGCAVCDGTVGAGLAPGTWEELPSWDVCTREDSIRTA